MKTVITWAILANVANAAIVSYDFSGSVDQMENGPIAGVSVGSPVSGMFAVDTNAAETGHWGDHHRFDQAVTNYALLVGDLDFTGGLNSANYLANSVLVDLYEPRVGNHVTNRIYLSIDGVEAQEELGVFAHLPNQADAELHVLYGFVREPHPLSVRMRAEVTSIEKTGITYDARDLNNLALHWHTDIDAGMMSQGDFNGDGRADAADLNELALNWQSTSVTAAAVPEPTTMILLLSGVLCYVCTHQRQTYSRRRPSTRSNSAASNGHVGG